MGWNEEITEYLPVDVSLPAIGQGALADRGARDDEFIRSLLSTLDDPTTHTAVTAERALLNRLQGDGAKFLLPPMRRSSRIGWSLAGLVCSTNGTTLVRDSINGSTVEAYSLGTRLGGPAPSCRRRRHFAGNLWPRLRSAFRRRGWCIWSAPGLGDPQLLTLREKDAWNAQTL